jgi:hypothetical protein
MIRLEEAREDIHPVVEAVGMWEYRRDFQRVWEGWEAGIMAFHTLPFPWPAFRTANAEQADMPSPSAMCRTCHEMLIGTRRLSSSALAISRQLRIVSEGDQLDRICLGIQRFLEVISAFLHRLGFSLAINLIWTYAKIPKSRY